MKRSFQALLVVLLIIVFAQPQRIYVANAQAPALRLTFPTQVAVGAQIDLVLTLTQMEQVGGFETTVRFAPQAAHFNGVTHHLEALRGSGRAAEPLGAVEHATGVTFGAYTCPLTTCVAPYTGPRQNQGVSGDIPVATVALIADQPGTLELAIREAVVVDVTGQRIDLSGAEQTIRIQVGTETEPVLTAPAPQNTRSTVAASSAAAGPFDLTGDGQVGHADVMEVALAWTLARSAELPCDALPDPRRDVSHDGCLNIADLQLVTAQYQVEEVQRQAVLVATGATFTVTTTSDDDDALLGDGICATKAGGCSLRAAIGEANRASGANYIAFAIPGDQVQTIALQSQLPSINDESGALTIDGYTQPGARPNDDLLVSNAKIRVQVSIAATDRSGAPLEPSTLEALHITSAGNTIRGLAFFKFRRALWLFGNTADTNRIVGNFIGTDAAGNYVASKHADDGNGVDLRLGASANQIGGSDPAERNVIAGNPKNGIATHNGGTDQNRIIGNLVGLHPSGTKALPNISIGIDINSHSSNNIIGGMTLGERNVISGNMVEGIEISHGERTKGNQVLGNFIGSDVTGTAAPPYSANGAYGVHIDDGPTNTVVAYNVVVNNTKGGIGIDGAYSGFSPVGNRVYSNRVGIGINDTPLANKGFGVFIKDQSRQSLIGPDNIIAHNPVGVWIEGDATDRNTITRNRIFANTGLGIDIAPIDASNPNDVNDIDSGANEQLNYPVLTEAHAYRVHGTTCVTCTVELFLVGKTTSAHGQADRFVTSVKPDSTGHFMARVNQLPVGGYVTATATDALGNTSEFALNMRIAEPEPGGFFFELYLPIMLR